MVNDCWTAFPVLFVLFMFGHVRPDDMFSSVVALEKLADTEADFVDMLQRYIADEERRLERLKNLSASHRLPEQQLMAGVAWGECSNAIDAFTLIKRSVDTTDAYLTIMLENTLDELEQEYDVRSLPTEVDLDGAAMALFRIQDTYLLSAKYLLNYGVPGSDAVPKFSADDCFHLGYTAAQHANFYHAVEWLTESLRLMQEEDQTLAGDDVTLLARNFNQSLLYDYLSYSFHEQQNFEWAVFLARQLRQIDPYYPVDKLDLYEDSLFRSDSNWDGSRENLPVAENLRPLKEVYLDYEALCRGETIMSNAEASKLICYRKMNTPYLMLAPLKAELRHRDPDIILFHDVISDAEIATLKTLAAPHLQRAKVVKSMDEVKRDKEKAEAKRRRLGFSDFDRAHGQDKMMIAPYRIAKNTWFGDHEHDVVARLSRRVEQMTDLTASTAEGLQVANYGLGGHYEPHYDMTTAEDSDEVHNKEAGNRIATVLFYETYYQQLIVSKNKRQRDEDIDRVIKKKIHHEILMMPGTVISARMVTRTKGRPETIANAKSKC